MASDFGPVNDDLAGTHEQEISVIANGLDSQELVDWLVEKVGTYLNVAPETIDVDIPLADCGIDSSMSLSLCADLQCEHGFDVDTTIVWDYPTISAIAEYLTDAAHKL